MSCVMKNKILLVVTILLIAISVAVGYYAYNKNKDYATLQVNNYNESFGNLVNYMNSVESLLAKSMISKNSNHSAETLTEVWRDSNLALVYLTRIPMNSEELSRCCKIFKSG